MKLVFNNAFVIDSTKEPWSREGIRLGIYGAPGSGKSYAAAAAVVEPFLEQGGTVVIFQPRAEWQTLKEKWPDLQVIGGPYYSDVPFVASHPKLYAEAVVEQGISMVFYTPDVDDEEKLVNFVDRFLDYVMKLEEVHHRPLLVVLEEAHEYAPKSPQGHVAPSWVFNRMVKRCKDLWTGGRKLNIVPLAITQRPQELHFSIRQLCNGSFYGKFSAQDIKYIDKECLSEYRKQGIDVNAAELAMVHAGQFLIIAHGDAKYETLGVKRVTPHGADTPQLDFVPVASAKVKSAASVLAKSLEELIARAQHDESELAKAKRLLKERDDRIAELDEKVKLAGNLREMLQHPKDSPKGDAPVMDRERRLADAYERSNERIMELEGTLKTEVGLRMQAENRAEALESEIEPLRKEKERMAAFGLAEEGLKQVFLPIVRDIVREETRSKGMVIDHAGTEATIRQTDPLKADFDTSNTGGRVMYVIVHDIKKPSSEAMISEAMQEYAWANSHGTVSPAIAKLVEKNWLVKEGSDPVLYRPAAKVAFKPDKVVEKK